MSNHNCESCGMSIESGRYCQYCAGEDGRLPPFEESFERMVQWMWRERPALSRAEAEQQTLAYMKDMPAWRDDPALKARQSKAR